MDIQPYRIPASDPCAARQAIAHPVRTSTRDTDTESLTSVPHLPFTISCTSNRAPLTSNIMLKGAVLRHDLILVRRSSFRRLLPVRNNRPVRQLALMADQYPIGREDLLSAIFSKNLRRKQNIFAAATSDDSGSSLLRSGIFALPARRKFRVAHVSASTIHPNQSGERKGRRRNSKKEAHSRFRFSEIDTLRLRDSNWSSTTLWSTRAGTLTFWRSRNQIAARCTDRAVTRRAGESSDQRDREQNNQSAPKRLDRAAYFIKQVAH